MIQNALARGAPIPPQLLDVPDVEPGEEPYWRAFWTLHHGRQVHVGLGGAVFQPIPYSEISAYARDHIGFDVPAEMDGLVRCVQELDREFLKVMSERQKAAEKKQGSR